MTEANLQAEQTSEQMIDELAAFLGVEDQLPEATDESTAERAEEVTPDEGADTVEDTHAEEVKDDERADADGEEGDEPWIPSSLEELAEALKVDPEQLAATLKVRKKVDGEESEVTLADLRKTSQLDSALNKRLEAVANERKAIEAQFRAYQEKQSDAENTVKALEQMLAADYNRIDWDDLRENDSTEFMLKERELINRYQQLMGVKQKLEETSTKEREEQQQKHQEALEQYKRQQAEKLVVKLPEWRDPKTYEAEIPDLVEYMRRDGSTDQELQQIADHRIWVWAKKAMEFDKMKTTADPKAKQLKSKPKFVPPGKRQANTSRRDNAVKDTFKRAQQLQTDEAWADALVARMSET